MDQDSFFGVNSYSSVS